MPCHHSRDGETHRHRRATPTSEAVPQKQLLEHASPNAPHTAALELHHSVSARSLAAAPPPPPMIYVQPDAVGPAAVTSPGTTAPRSVVPSPALRFRTRMCDTYALDGTCNFGARCAFAHSREDLRTVAQNEADGLTTDREVALFLHRRNSDQQAATPQQAPLLPLPPHQVHHSQHPHHHQHHHQYVVPSWPLHPPPPQHAPAHQHYHYYHHHNNNPYMVAVGGHPYHHALFPAHHQTIHAGSSGGHGMPQSPHLPVALPPSSLGAPMYHVQHHHTYHHHHAYPDPGQHSALRGGPVAVVLSSAPPPAATHEPGGGTSPQ